MLLGSITDFSFSSRRASFEFSVLPTDRSWPRYPRALLLQPSRRLTGPLLSCCRPMRTLSLPAREGNHSRRHTTRCRTHLTYSLQNETCQHCNDASDPCSLSDGSELQVVKPCAKKGTVGPLSPSAVRSPLMFAFSSRLSSKAPLYLARHWQLHNTAFLHIDPTRPTPCCSFAGCTGDGPCDCVGNVSVRG